MPAANPYAAQLGNLDARAVISETPSELSRLCNRLGPQGLERSLAPGKWSAAKILIHLADCEIAFAFRLRQALAEPNHVLQPFDQDAWARPYDSLQPQTAVEVFSTLRRWNLALLNAIPAEALDKPVSHPERGQMIYRTLIETMGGHDLNHRRQLETIASQTAA
jgi:hypothetical protein